MSYFPGSLRAGFALVFFLMGVLLWLPNPVLADKIKFKPGNILAGTLHGFSGGTVLFSTPDSPKVKIPAGKIIKVYTKKHVVVVMRNNARLIGRLVPVRGKGKFGIRLASAKGRKKPVVLSWGDVKAINPPDRHWAGSVALGGGTQTGNTERTNLSVSGEGELALKRDSFFLSFLHNFAEENDKVTARNTYGSFKFEHSFNSKWFWLLSSELLNDKFKDLNLRAIIGPGVGYTIWDDDVKVLKLEGGLSYFSEDLKVGMDDQWFTARFAGRFTYKLFEWLKFVNKVLVYPSVEDLNDFTLRNEANIIANMGDGWGIKVSNILEHNSMPPLGVVKDDTTWIYSVQYEF
ncbi:MAG: DUF481 domain-containing protein [Candidatus Nitronauta litoralis]|uniref:DUF481 domain-containing protein n=1 Tax=Candidatus Nitronauta litoralis TaxID=2705533 RepID=A0A7T0BZS8_9BACT|nr:MAG: DUF481 domain-containing protein [Candidatus Nitronauta litoralis]